MQFGLALSTARARSLRGIATHDERLGGRAALVRASRCDGSSTSSRCGSGSTRCCAASHRRRPSGCGSTCLFGEQGTPLRPPPAREPADRGTRLPRDLSAHADPMDSRPASSRATRHTRSSRRRPQPRPRTACPRLAGRCRAPGLPELAAEQEPRTIARSAHGAERTRSLPGESVTLFAAKVAADDLGTGSPGEQQEAPTLSPERIAGGQESRDLDPAARTISVTGEMDQRGMEEVQHPPSAMRHYARGGAPVRARGSGAGTPRAAPASARRALSAARSAHRVQVAGGPAARAGNHGRVAGIAVRCASPEGR